MDDTIYRQAAIDALYHVDEYNGRSIKAIRNLPSARPETTRKVLASSRGGITMWYKCEKCGQSADPSDNYCRCCGRRFING